MIIINLTGKITTTEQKIDGVVEPMNRDTVINLLTFDQIPTNKEIFIRANKLTHVAMDNGAKGVLIDGPGWLIGALELDLQDHMIKPFYSFVKRVPAKIQTGHEPLFVNLPAHIGFVGPYLSDTSHWPKTDKNIVCVRCGNVDEVHSFQHTDEYDLFHCDHCNKDFKVWW